MQGRIVNIINEFYYIREEYATPSSCWVEAKLKGSLLKSDHLPIVGDIVEYELLDEGGALITNIYPRNNRLLKPVVANVDQIIIVVSVDNPKPNFQLIDRLLVWAHFERFNSAICVNKKELNWKKAEEIEHKYCLAGYPSTQISVAEQNLGNLPKLLTGNISVLAGQSGVGKSSILNVLRPDLNLQISEVSKKGGTGKHTTRSCQLFQVNKGYLADTPGFNKKKLPNIFPERLELAFPEIADKSKYCKFNDCSHRREPGCYVKQHIGTEISQLRYEHFVLFFEELVEKERRY